MSDEVYNLKKVANTFLKADEEYAAELEQRIRQLEAERDVHATQRASALRSLSVLLAAVGPFVDDDNSTDERDYETLQKAVGSIVSQAVKDFIGDDRRAEDEQHRRLVDAEV